MIIMQRMVHIAHTGSARFCAVTSCNEEEVFYIAALYRADDSLGNTHHSVVAETDCDFLVRSRQLVSKPSASRKQAS